MYLLFCFQCNQAERVKEVQTASESYTAMLKEKLKEKLEGKLAETDNNRKAQIQLLQERLREHVCWGNKGFLLQYKQIKLYI